MSEELTTVEVTDEIKVVMENKNFIPSSEDIECYGKHQIKPSEILPCPFCGSEHLYFGDWGMHGTQDKVSCGNECIERVPVETWNSRPAEEALQKRIAELEAERDRLREALQRISCCHGTRRRDALPRQKRSDDRGPIYFHCQTKRKSP